MPTKLRNTVFFTSKNRDYFPSRLLRVGGIFRSLFGVRLPRTSSSLFSRLRLRTLEERQQDCDQRAYDQYRQKDERPQAGDGRSGKIDLSGSSAKHEPETLGVIIKNQNVLHAPALGRIC